MPVTADYLHERRQPVVIGGSSPLLALVEALDIEPRFEGRNIQVLFRRGERKHWLLAGSFPLLLGRVLPPRQWSPPVLTAA